MKFQPSYKLFSRLFFVFLGVSLLLSVHLLFLKNMTVDPSSKESVSSRVQETSNENLLPQSISTELLIDAQPENIRQSNPETNPEINDVIKTLDIKGEIIPKLKAKNTYKIAIVIDDMGVDRDRSAQMVDLGYPLTLSYLPYASGVEEQVAYARTKNHEIMAHIPMMPKSNDVNPGPDVLKLNMKQADMAAIIKEAVQKIGPITMINNHMGSAFTEDKAAMQNLFTALEGQNLSFLDSRTIASSKAMAVGQGADVSVIERDVFLDHEATDEFVVSALARLEGVAKRNGHAIAIGHPKDVTYNALKKWIPDALSRGFEIVTVSALLNSSEAENISTSKSQ